MKIEKTRKNIIVTLKCIVQLISVTAAPSKNDYLRVDHEGGGESCRCVQYGRIWEEAELNFTEIQLRITPLNFVL